MQDGAEIADERGNPYAKLGVRFWAPWALAFVAVNALMIGGGIVLRPMMGTLPGAIGGGAAMIVLTLLLVGLCLLPMRALQKRGLEGRMRAPYRRYTARMIPAMLGYVVCLIAAIMYAREYKPEGVIAILIALAPALPTLLAIRAITLLPREEDDEYLRDKLYRSYALGAGATMAVCTVWGFLDMFEVVEHVELYVVFPIWAVCSGLARLVPMERAK